MKRTREAGGLSAYDSFADAQFKRISDEVTRAAQERKTGVANAHVDVSSAAEPPKPAQAPAPKRWLGLF